MNYKSIYVITGDDVNSRADHRKVLAYVSGPKALAAAKKRRLRLEDIEIVEYAPVNHGEKTAD